MFHAKLVYDKKADCQSRVCPDYERVANVDEKGNEYVFFEMCDYPKIQSSLGTFDQWSLRSLMSAGIDPNFNIRTGFGTGLESELAIGAAAAAVIGVVDSENKA